MLTIAQAFALALQHHQAGRLAEAEALYRQILAVQPGHAEALHLIGVIAHQAGRHDLAVEWMQQAILVHPTFADAYYNLGIVFNAQKRSEDAIAAYCRAIEIKPDFADAYYNLGIVLQERGRLDEAVGAYERAIGLRPEFVNAHNNLGAALKERGKFDEAISEYRRAIQLDPKLPAAHCNLGNVLRNQGNLDEAITEYCLAIKLKPDYLDAHVNLGVALNDRGQIDDAIAAYISALQLHPNRSDIHSNLIYALHFHVRHDDRSIAGEHQRWNQQFAKPLNSCFKPRNNTIQPERRLRVGYVSPDFCSHVICNFLTGLLREHDHTRFEIYCYASVKHPDHVTARLKKTADVWRDVLDVSDEGLAERIREDKIDLLVDLSQHMANNRLLTFARQPAPVQIAWLGYPGSTGLEAMDYRLTDAKMDPEGAAWSKSVETPVRLPDSWFCFDPVDDYPEPGGLPALRAGYVTFGSLNTFCKVNETAFHLWTEILKAVEGSRLLLHCPAGETQIRVRQWFQLHGIAADRLELVSRTATHAEFLQLLERIDIGLETFPYNGGATTCDALCMGVPVPTLPGSTVVSRLGLSILSAGGLSELVAVSPMDYVQLVTTLATDLPRLAELRSTLRHRLKISALMDAPRFARNIEAAYRAMWRRWCAQAPA